MLLIFVQGDDLDRDVPGLGVFFNWLITVQPSMSGRKISSDTAAGLNSSASSSASSPRLAVTTLKPSSCAISIRILA
jgi:hypothetical protein